MDTGEMVAMGIVDARKFNELGVTQLTAVGGAAEMFPKAKEHFESLGAVFKNDDARFVIDEQYLVQIANMALGPIARFCERSVLRECREELVDEPIGSTIVLAPEQAARLGEHFLCSVRQALPIDGRGSSLNAGDIPSHRFFNLFLLRAPGDVFDQIVDSGAIWLLSQEELDTTNRGATKGRARSGEEMSDNLGNWLPGLVTR